MPCDPLHDAVYLGIEAAIEENYRGVDGSYPVSPSAVATLATSAALAALVEHGYAIASAADPRPPLPAVPDKFSVKVMTSLSPYSPEYLADLLDLDAADLRDRYGDTVLYGLGDEGLPEFRRGGVEPSPAEVREAAAILRQATGSGTAPQPPGTIQDASEDGPGISGRSDDPKGTETLSALRLDIARSIRQRVRISPDGRAGELLAAGDPIRMSGAEAEDAADAALAVRDEELKTLQQAREIQRGQIRAYVSDHQEDTARWSRDLEAARRALFDAAKITGADLDGATSHDGIAGDLAAFALDAVRELRSNYDEEAERTERLAQLRDYAIHRRRCLFWVRRPCDCGLAALDSPKGATP